MCIGINKSGIPQKLIQGKEIGTFDTEVKARAKAKENEGSEIVYRTEDNQWHVAEIKEEGVLWGQEDLSLADVCKIDLNEKHFKTSKIKDVSISFVEGNNVEFISSRPVGQAEFNWAKNLMNKVKNEEYQPSDLERRKYEQISNRHKEIGTEAEQLELLKIPPSPAVSRAEQVWAFRFDEKLKNGTTDENGKKVKFNPDKNEQARYDEIKSRSK